MGESKHFKASFGALHRRRTAQVAALIVLQLHVNRHNHVVKDPCGREKPAH